MSQGRRRVNITLIILSLVLGVWAAWISRQPASSVADSRQSAPLPADTARQAETPDILKRQVAVAATNDSIHNDSQSAQSSATPADRHIRTATLPDANIRVMTGPHPFAAEAGKVLSGRLAVADSLSRHRILSYCEHLRTAYTTRDIDFLRQVFSDDALIIVGHTVWSTHASGLKGSQRVTYSIRSKHEYLQRLARIFDSGKEISLDFSGFRILRHPTMEGIYGVTLRQRYKCGDYSDDGWLFLLWDFRDPSMPLIHVRTWQPESAVADTDDLIDLSDFNLE